MEEPQIYLEHPLTRLILIAMLLYAGLMLVIALLRRVLWLLTPVFMLLDQLVWFLYNPLRPFMKDYRGGRSRGFFVLFRLLLIRPVWMLAVYTITTPVRLITALYFDVMVYLLVMSSDTIDELLHPKLGKMRYKTGFAYGWRWVLFLPYRLIWFFVKNGLAMLDSVMMFTISIVWPTFTMYHGTSREAATNISQKGRWYVGAGNFAGSGIYFGRRLTTAMHYAKPHHHGGQKLYPIIMARVSFTLLRNCGTLKKEQRDLVGRMSESGNQLSMSVKWPYAATELWRNFGKGWWEYCILQKGRQGQYVKSWRIRPVGLVEVRESGLLASSLTRLWGGASHYSLRPANFLMAYFSGLFAACCAIALGDWALFRSLLSLIAST